MKPENPVSIDQIALALVNVPEEHMEEVGRRLMAVYRTRLLQQRPGIGEEEIQRETQRWLAAILKGIGKIEAGSGGQGGTA